jgi:hypothetical protein
LDRIDWRSKFVRDGLRHFFASGDAKANSLFEMRADAAVRD